MAAMGDATRRAVERRPIATLQQPLGRRRGAGWRPAHWLLHPRAQAALPVASGEVAMAHLADDRSGHHWHRAITHRPRVAPARAVRGCTGRRRSDLHATPQLRGRLVVESADGRRSGDQLWDTW